MQLKHLLVALVVLLAFVGTAAAADSVEIRSTIINAGTTGPTALDVDTDGDSTDDSWLLDAKNWAGFYYDLNDNISTEKMFIKPNAAHGAVTQLNITYETTATTQSYATNYTHNPVVAQTFAVIGFFAEPYVAIGPVSLVAANSPATDANAGKLAKLVIDDDESYLMKTGSTLELGEGYTVVADQIDVDGNKALLRFMKDGREINASIVTTAANTPGFWDLDATVLGEKDTSVLRVRVESVFQGTQDSLVEISGVWLIDYLNAMEIKDGDDFGKFENATIRDHVFTIDAKNLSFSGDLNTHLGNGIYLQTEKTLTATSADFFLYKEFTEPGVYEIRSNVFEFVTGTSAASGLSTPVSYTYKQFAAFHYDLDSGAYDELLTMTTTASSATVAKGNLKYVTTPVAVPFAFAPVATTPATDAKYDWRLSGGDEFSGLGLFGEKYVAIDGKGAGSSDTPEKMAKLVIDDDESYLLKTGATLELGDGYTIIADQIDVDGNKALLRFMKDGRELNTSIVTTDQTGGNWFLNVTVLNEKSTEVLRVYVASVFQGTQDSLVEIGAVWAIDYLNATEVKDGDMYGILKADVGSSSLTFASDSDLTLTHDMDKLIANNMYLKTADTTGAAGRGYFYVEATVGEGNPEPPVIDTPQPPETPGPETPEPQPPEVVTPPENNTDGGDEKGFLAKYGWIIAAIILIIIIAGVAYYFLVMKKQ
jgi:S-layer-related duplication domain